MHRQAVARPGNGTTLPDHTQVALPRTEAFSQTMLRLPVIPNADNGIIDDYIEAFTKVSENYPAIVKRT